MMCVSLSREFWQKIFITLNTLFVIFNMILLILGIITQNTLSKYTTILHTPISAIIPTILFTGCFGLIAALIGYIGLWKPMNSIALMHIISLCIVTLIEIGIATTSAVMYDQFYTTTHSALLDSVKFYYENPHYEMEMDHLQTEVMIHFIFIIIVYMIEILICLDMTFMLIMFSFSSSFSYVCCCS
ncbi:unnamed protein product [Schistosoma bovis]|nr:unnamed protein product [Schistosoma bovis]